MPYYFYTGADGQKQTVNEQQLQGLINQGIILPTTPLETDSGHSGLAGQIPGLNFNTASPSPFAQPTQAPQTLARQAGMMATNVGVGGILLWLLWLLDFTFRDIWLHKNGRRVCSFLYICCIVTLAINGLLGVCLLNPMYSAETMIATLVFLVCYLLSSFIFLVFVRVICELLIVLLDWVAENKKASRLYIENSEKGQA